MTCIHCDRPSSGPLCAVCYTKRVKLATGALTHKDAATVNSAILVALDFLSAEAADSDRDTWNEGGDGYAAITALGGAASLLQDSISRPLVKP